MISEKTLREQYPDIPWDDPVSLTITSYVTVWACRYCVAMQGIRARDVIEGRASDMAYQSRTDALMHIVNEHHE